MSEIPAKTYSIWNDGIHLESIWNEVDSRRIPCGIRGESKDLIIQQQQKSSTRAPFYQTLLLKGIGTLMMTPTLIQIPYMLLLKWLLWYISRKSRIPTKMQIKWRVQ